MTSFINNDVASGATVRASDHNTQGALIAAILNGNVDSGNLAAKGANLDRINGGTTDGVLLTDASGNVTGGPITNAKLSTTAGELGGAWTTWTPTITAGVGTFTSVAGAGYYTRIGKTISFQLTITVTTNGTAATSTIFTLPVTAARINWMGVGRETTLSAKMLQVRGFTTNAFIYDYTGAYAGGNTATLVISGTYEAA